jgi:S1-C subfamily serine protease
MVPDGSAEDNHAASCWISNEVRKRLDVNRFIGDVNPHQFVFIHRYVFLVHTITIMHEDTPDATPSDSHVPLTSERNEDDLTGVGTNMDPTETPNVPTSDTSEFAVMPEASEPTVDAPDSPIDTEYPPYVPFVFDNPRTPDLEEAPVELVSERISPSTEKRGSGSWLFLAGAVVAGILGALLTVGILAATGTFDDPETVTAPPATTANAEQAAQPVEIPPTQIINNLGSSVNPTAVATKAVPSIVTVTVGKSGEEGEAAIGVGSGSGVVMSAEGHIITNHHVIDGGDTFSVEFENGRVYEAVLVGSDDLTDIAVLKISATGLTPADFGSSDALNLGDSVVAIGNPLGQEGGASVTVGIVSAFDRRVDFSGDDFLHGMIQTDAAINSGSSGGALFNVDGDLIGITSAIGVSQAGPEGIGYAIPVELVDRISAEIIEVGDVAHPFLGVTVGTHYVETDDGAIAPSGAIIDSIEGTDSAAGLSGLEAGDVVVAIGDKEINDQTGLILAVRLYRVGDEVEFVVLRDGENETFMVVMGQRPAELGG